MEDDIRELERRVEAGMGTPDEIQRYIRAKVRGGCEAGAHGALVPEAVDSDRLVCELCRQPSGFEIPGVGKMLIPPKTREELDREQQEAFRLEMAELRERRARGS